MPRDAGREVPANATSLREHVYGERVGPWVSTSTEYTQAQEFAGDGGWIYAIDRPATGVDVNQELGAAADEAYGIEHEVAVPGGIAGDQIQFAYQVDESGATTAVRVNPGYAGHVPLPPPSPAPVPPPPPGDEL
jgi:hypothetical protein